MVDPAELFDPAKLFDPAELFDPADPVGPVLREAVSAALGDFLAGQRRVLAEVGPELDRLVALAAELLAGGKRLRPAFCLWGYVAVGGSPPADVLVALVRAAASLDLLHVSALVHDDVMDASDVRRGRPAAHRQLEAEHRRAGRLGDAATFGEAGAILLGDLLLMWSAELLHRSGLDPVTLDAALPVVEAMRTEVTAGQYIDMAAQARPWPDEAGGTGDRDDTGALEDAGRVVEFKSARYTVQRPCQLGAALAGADAAQLRALAAYGSPLGRAFQYRDDLLGVFGDPAVTGKPAGDDLREGKRTVLVAHAYAAADVGGRRLMRAGLGRSDLGAQGVAELQDVIAASGAREATEQMISAGFHQAVAALDGAPVTDLGRAGLRGLAEVAVRRTA